MKISVKICGITTEDAMEAAVDGGAAFVGVVFHPSSPRSVTVERAAELLDFMSDDTQKVGLFVNPDDRLLDAVLTHCRLDVIQLHGAESVDRVESLRLEYGLPVMKAVAVETLDDIIHAVETWADTADWLLLDAKPSTAATRVGGNGVAFDWSLPARWQQQEGGLKNWPLPWILAGGLTPDNVANALEQSKAIAVDVSSGVEDALGQKSVEKITAFLKAAHSFLR